MKRGKMRRLEISARGVVSASALSLALCVGVVVVADALRTPAPPPQPTAAQGFHAAAVAPAFDASKTQPLDVPPVLGPATPTRVRIPAINVSAPLMSLGLDSRGAWPHRRSRTATSRGGTAAGRRPVRSAPRWSPGTSTTRKAPQCSTASGR